MAATCDYDKCADFLDCGECIDVDAFLPWWHEHKDEPWAKERDDGGMNKHGWCNRRQSFLQRALGNECPMEVVRAVFAAHPAAAIGVCDDGRTALHAAVLYKERTRTHATRGAVEDLILDVLHAWPAATKVADTHSAETPLCEALLLIGEACLSDSVLLQLIQAGGSDAAKMEPDFSNSAYGDGTPLNISLHWGASSVVVEALYNVWPGALDVKNGEERDPETACTPLEYQIFRGPPFAAIEQQLQIFKRDFDRCYFLLRAGKHMHVDYFMACWVNWKTNDWVKLKTPNWGKNTARKLDKSRDWPITGAGNTLLHVALIHSAPEAVTLAIIDAWKEATHESTIDRGKTPLAVAVEGGVESTAVISALLDAWKGAARQVDSYGQTPLKLAFNALDSNAPQTVFIFKMVLDEWPLALVQKESRNGNVMTILAPFADSGRGYGGCKQVTDATIYTICGHILDAWNSMADELDMCAHAPTLLHVALNRRKFKQVDAFTTIVLHIVDTCPQLVQQKNTDGDTPLHVALKMNWADVVIETLLTAWPAAISAANNDGKTPLHMRIFPAAPAAAVARHLKSFSSATACCLSMFESKHNLNVDVFLTWWDECRRNHMDVAIANDDANLPLLHVALLSNVPEPAMLAVLESSAEDVFSTVRSFEDNTDRSCRTALEIGIEYQAPEAVLLAIIDAWPAAVKEKPRQTQHCPCPTLAALAVQKLVPVAVLTKMLTLFPEAAEDNTVVCQISRRSTTGGGTSRVTGNNLMHVLAHAGNPPLHEIDADLREFDASRGIRNISINEHNALCYVLAGTVPGTRVSATEKNAGDNDFGGYSLFKMGQSTPGEVALWMRSAVLSPNNAFKQNSITSRKIVFYKRAHLAATFDEIAKFQASPHLGKKHLRDWTTVSHAWCTPSAKLTALTVLMVGETYKRELLPRLPMDAWYIILNMIPRYELRQHGGRCKLADEQAALAQYNAILKAARSGGK